MITPVQSKATSGLEMATLAGGCFWGFELAYQRTHGVVETAVGYTQGHTDKPSYEDVCSGSTGHTEAVQLYYDPSVVSYKQLLGIMLSRIDPTTINRQGNDLGSQYRSGIYFHTEEQRQAAVEVMNEVNRQLQAGTYPHTTIGNRWEVEIKPVTDFWAAEEYHQQYLSKGGRYGQGQCSAKGCSDPIRCYG